MRTGTCTLQQALSVEAASVLKLSLSLARSRGHAHVTPLHVAATILTSLSFPGSSLLRRACLKSQHHQLTASQPLQCCALELCFNVALNRLPTTPQPSSPSSFLSPQPALSNALIAALKRAQAHQRRGCIELQQQQQQQQPPLLAVKVEVEQLVISILDDPSVSRVMREAGFSSTCVKNSLEEESSFLFQGSGLWQSPLLKLSSSCTCRQRSSKESVSAVLQVMLTRQGGRRNVVVVGDSVSLAEAVVAGLISKVERGDVPDELKTVNFVKLQVSYVHLKLMSKSDVDLKVSDLRRKIASLGGGVIVYAGDLRWAFDEEADDGRGFRPVEHMVAELGRLMNDLRSGNGFGAVWFLATASYQIYTRCQMRQPSLETLWALQGVVVPSGGLALSLQAPSGIESRFTKQFKHPFRLLDSNSHSTSTEDDDDERLHCCTECTAKFEKEALAFKSEVKDTNSGSTTQLPLWMHRHRPENHKDALLEITGKWNSLCQSLHHSRQNQLIPPLFSQSPVGKNDSCSSYPWWLNSSHSKALMQSHCLSSSQASAKLDGRFRFSKVNATKGISKNSRERNEPPKLMLSQVSLSSLKSPGDEDVKITLSLGGALMPSDSAISKKQAMAERAELIQRVQENIPWQSQTISSIVESVLNDAKSHEHKGLRILLQGSDCIAKRRLTRLMLQHFGGSKDRLIQLSMKKWYKKASSCRATLEESLGKDSKFVVLIEEIDQAETNFLRYLIDVLNVGAFESSDGKQVQLNDTIFIMTTSDSTNYEEECADNVIKIKLQAEERSTDEELKRKSEITSALHTKPKRLKIDQDRCLDLNLLAKEGEEEFDGDSNDNEAAPSDLTNEMGCINSNLPFELLDLITARFVLAADPGRSSTVASEALLSKLHRAFDEVRMGGAYEGTGRLLVDETVADELAVASSFFLESCLGRWVEEVFKAGLRRVKKGGDVRLCVEGKEEGVQEFGFMGSVLPGRIRVLM